MTLHDLRQLVLPTLRRLRRDFAERRIVLPAIIVAGVVALIFTFSKASDRTVHKSIVKPAGEYHSQRVLSAPANSIVDGKERILAKRTAEVQRFQKTVLDQFATFDRRLADLETHTSQVPTSPPPTPIPPPAQALPGSQAEAQSSGDPAIRSRSYGGRPQYPTLSRSGPEVISFPVKGQKSEQEVTITIPSGSFVKAKLLTGVEAPEGKTYPVLVQLDFAYILPNHHRLDLSGCFMILKATGNLSIERVEMQATKLSCVAQNGTMFERKVNGFIADDRDNSFAVMGRVNTKQHRVAATAFLTSVVAGIGRAIQQAQTTQQTTPLGGSQSVVTGSQAQFIGAGGAATAAEMVAQWYLRQAQNLLPTINVGSGQDVWVVLQEQVHLPQSYFHSLTKGEEDESMFTYFTNLLN